MQISKKAQYGLRAMVYLAKVSKEKQVCPLKEIAQAEDIPFDFLEKIILELEKNNLVKAKKGSKGGYYLAKKPKDITVNKIVETLETTTAPVGCMGCAKARTCLSKSAWTELKDSMESTLKGISLEDLIKQ